jgi:hypothetical protein
MASWHMINVSSRSACSANISSNTFDEFGLSLLQDLGKFLSSSFQPTQPSGCSEVAHSGQDITESASMIRGRPMSNVLETSTRMLLTFRDGSESINNLKVQLNDMAVEGHSTQ